jgi:hypothetical protein
MVGLCLVFGLPWLVPVLGPPVTSDSYAFGFSNGTAITGCFAMACGLALASSRWTPRFLAGGKGLWDVNQATTVSIRWAAFGVTIASLCAVSVLGLLTHGSPYAESGYFLNRIAYAAAGYSPFSELHYPYGLLALYLPVALWRAFHGFGLDAQMAYFIVFGLFTVLSWVMLAYVVGRLTLSAGQRLALFLALAAPCWLSYDLGIQLLYVRFLTPLFGMLLLHLYLTRHLPNHTPRSQIAAGALAGLVPALTVALSSADLAVASTLAVLVYLGLTVRDNWPGGLLAPATFVIFCAVGSVLMGGGYFAFVFAFGGGAYNFPVLPGPVVLMLVACVGITAICLPALFRTGEERDRRLMIGVVVLALGQLPAALGRADFIHVFWNGTIWFLMAFTLIGRRSRAALAVALILFSGLLLVAQTRYVDGYVPRLVRAGVINGVLNQSGLRGMAEALGKDASVGDWYYAQYAPMRSQWSPAVLDAYPALGAPLGFEEVEGAFRVANRGALDSYAAAGAFSLEDLREQLRTQPAPYLLLPAGLQVGPMAADLRAAGGMVNTGSSDSSAYERQLLFPVTLQQRNPQPAISAAFSDYVWRHYVRLEVTGPYSVWKRIQE